jgi:DNA-binding ferritin-like protein
MVSKSRKQSHSHTSSRSQSCRKSMKVSHSKTHTHSCVKQLMNTYIKPMMTLRHAIKLYHWTTTSFPLHKTTDEFLSLLDTMTDKYVEVYLGLYKTQGDKLIKQELKTIHVRPFETPKHLYQTIQSFGDKLRNHEQICNEPSLIAVRDELISEIEKFKYLQEFA